MELLSWEQIWEQNIVKTMRTSGTWRTRLDGSTSVYLQHETDRNPRDRDRFAHNPEVAGSNPVPATSGNDPRGATSGVIFMPLGNGFGNMSIANCLARLVPKLQSSPIRTVTASPAG